VRPPRRSAAAAVDVRSLGSAGVVTRRRYAARSRSARNCSRVNLDSVESVSVGVLIERLGRLGDDRMVEICAALEVAVDCGH